MAKIDWDKYKDDIERMWKKWVDAWIENELGGQETTLIDFIDKPKQMVKQSVKNGQQVFLNFLKHKGKETADINDYGIVKWGWEMFGNRGQKKIKEKVYGEYDKREKEYKARTERVAKDEREIEDARESWKQQRHEAASILARQRWGSLKLTKEEMSRQSKILSTKATEDPAYIKKAKTESEKRKDAAEEYNKTEVKRWGKLKDKVDEWKV